MKKRIRKMRRRQEVVAETTSVMIRRRCSDAMPSPRALLEAPSTALLSSLFSIRRPKTTASELALLGKSKQRRSSNDAYDVFHNKGSHDEVFRLTGSTHGSLHEAATF